jgi:hypothetical protein
LGHVSERKAGGIFEQIDPNTLPLHGSSYYFEGLAGVWRYSDHIMMDASKVMSPEEFAAYGGKMGEDRIGTFTYFQKPESSDQAFSNAVTTSTIRHGVSSGIRCESQAT